MYCLLQLYLCVATELAPHRPVLKLFSIKAVGKFGLPTLDRLHLMEHTSPTVFLTFWQSTFLSLLSLIGVFKDVRLSLDLILMSGFLIIYYRHPMRLLEISSLGGVPSLRLLK